ncbi:hypothetical protein C7S20_19265 [Christiangramia fulva]|uniref:Uncharacterized protein n=2 Tax=Christiangramia fulva TaxID=2126553 RepID=A0A2R3ZA99_9FLAO|nr:hypothetical protein C7S20_19265 [Christiangramia fulva]
MAPIFAHLPAIAIWIEDEYKKAVTREDLFELVYKWLDKAEVSTNTIREQSYTICAHFLYSVLTNRNYATKQFQSY